jgi:hypothetical protein
MVNLIPSLPEKYIKRYVWVSNVPFLKNIPSPEKVHQVHQVFEFMYILSGEHRVNMASYFFSFLP